MNRPDRVAHVIGRLDIGGAERSLLSLCRGTPSGDITHSVIALSGSSGRWTSTFADLGVHETLCPISPALSFPWRFWRVLRAARPDVVVSHVSLASGYLLGIARLAGVTRRIAVFHSDGDGREPSPRRRTYRWLARALLRRSASRVVGVTPTTLSFSGFATADPRATVIPNGVDLAEFRPADRFKARATLGLPMEGTILAHVGRSAPEKNRQLLPRLLRALDPATTLVLAGADTVDDLGLAENDTLWDRIASLGAVDDICSVLAACDVLVLPSVREGLPLVVLEAIACGRPVVASDLPGLRSVIGELEDLRLVSTGASAVTFAAAVEETICGSRDPEVIRQTLVNSSMNVQCVARRWVALCREA